MSISLKFDAELSQKVDLPCPCCWASIIYHHQGYDPLEDNNEQCCSVCKLAIYHFPGPSMQQRDDTSGFQYLMHINSGLFKSSIFYIPNKAIFSLFAHLMWATPNIGLYLSPVLEKTMWRRRNFLPRKIKDNNLRL